MTSKDVRRISSLRDLPREIEPPRDLWADIEARLAVPLPAAAGADTEPDSAQRSGGWWRSRVGRRSGAAPATARWTHEAGRANRLRVFAAAAMIATLAFGIWIGRAVLPEAGKPAGGALSAKATTWGESGALQTAYVMDPKYMNQRAALLRSLEAQIAALPPDSRAKVLSSLRTIHDSMRDLEAALGRDPSNALLQELLVNTYQDEMRVLTAVHEVGEAGKGI